MKRLALAAILAAMAVPAGAVCTTLSGGLGLLVPNFSDSGTVWASCLQFDITTLNLGLASSTSTALQMGQLSVSTVTGLSGQTVYNGKYGVLFSTNVYFQYVMQGTAAAVSNGFYTNIDNGMGVEQTWLSTSSQTWKANQFSWGGSTMAVSYGSVAIQEPFSGYIPQSGLDIGGSFQWGRNGQNSTGTVAGYLNLASNAQLNLTGPNAYATFPSSVIIQGTIYGSCAGCTGISGVLSGGVVMYSSRWLSATSQAQGSFIDTGSSVTLPAGSPIGLMGDQNIYQGSWNSPLSSNQSSGTVSAQSSWNFAIPDLSSTTYRLHLKGTTSTATQARFSFPADTASHYRSSILAQGTGGQTSSGNLTAAYCQMSDVATSGNELDGNVDITYDFWASNMAMVGWPNNSGINGSGNPMYYTFGSCNWSGPGNGTVNLSSGTVTFSVGTFTGAWDIRELKP